MRPSGVEPGAAFFMSVFFIKIGFVAVGTEQDVRHPIRSVDCQVKLTHFFVESCPTLAADKVGVLRWVNSICQS